MAKSEKSRRTREDAEELFVGLAEPAVRSSTREANPFGDDFSWREELDEDDSNIVSVPRSVELPPGYESVEHLRQAVRRAWQVEWGNFTRDKVELCLPSRWKLVRAKNETSSIVDDTGSERAVFGRGTQNRLRLLPRYWIADKVSPKDGYIQLVVRDRQLDSTPVESSISWERQGGQNHSQWPVMVAWLEKNYPDHQDPLMCWDDCERHNEIPVDPV